MRTTELKTAKNLETKMQIQTMELKTEEFGDRNSGKDNEELGDNYLETRRSKKQEQSSFGKES